ncbi:GFA family protein [Paracoccus siganidrum]|uniref:GFA family protein n=1 Tax=Paracoccus siganidrum TaxID=1276757 RepID=A0A418ZXK2_9RHOB|nr:GFA family protein [Paracoccus siganidrum]RJL05248.1 GFA family protein [Paracoccus siganidrum]RMC37116.1 GFA family protein [Paracoccus siganidrum]
MSSERSDFTGQCLCGAVRFAGHAADQPFHVCHCGQCRRWSGHYWSAFEAEELRIDERDALRWFRSSQQAERGFCRHCGSSLFWRRIGSDRTEVAPGALDAPTGLRPSGHIYVADKGDYYDITDGLPQYAQESR